MMTLVSNIFVPVLMDVKYKSPIEDEAGRRNVGLVIGLTQKDCRDRFEKLMELPWKELAKKGWRVKNVEICANELEIYGEDALIL